jgi:hypothetical protein
MTTFTLVVWFTATTAIVVPNFTSKANCEAGYTQMDIELQRRIMSHICLEVK